MEQQVKTILEKLAENPIFSELKGFQDVNSKGSIGGTALHVAAIHGDIEAGQILLKAGADPNMKDEFGYTPLHSAALHGHLEFVKLLLDHGASKDVVNKSGETPARLAKGKLKELFGPEPEEDYSLQAQARRILDEMADLPDFDNIELLNVNSRGTLGDTPLHVAAVRGDIACARVLLEAGANPNIKGEYGYTPLHNAATHGHLGLAKLLIEHGALKDVLNDDGETPAQLAIWGLKEVFGPEIMEQLKHPSQSKAN